MAHDGDVVITPKEVYELVQGVEKKVDGIAYQVDVGVGGIKDLQDKHSNHEKRIRKVEQALAGLAGVGSILLGIAALLKVTGVF